MKEMSPKIKSDPEKITLSQSALQNMDQMSQPRNSQISQGMSNMASRVIQDDEISSQDNFSLCSSTQQPHGTPHGLSWPLGDVDALDNGAMASSKQESPEVQMLSFSLSQQLMPSTVGPSDVMYHNASDFPGIQDMGDQNDLDFAHAQDYHYSSLVDFTAYENDATGHNGTQSCTPDDSLSHSSHADDAQLSAHDTWNSMVTDSRNYQGSNMDQFSSSIFQTMPVSPPLTDASHDISVTSSCPHSGYPTYMTNEDAMLKDITATPMGTQGINLADPLFPLTPPLSDQDPNRLVLGIPLISTRRSLSS